MGKYEFEKVFAQLDGAQSALNKDPKLTRIQLLEEVNLLMS